MTLRPLRPALAASAAAICALGLLSAGCSKKDGVQTTTTTTTATTAAAPATVRAPAVTGAITPATATGPAGELGQTAAVSPPANSNGTTPPSPGVGPPGGPGAAEAPRE